MPETPQDAYDRGIEAGRIEARLDEYAQHFKVINGSIERTATGMHEMSLQIQRLADQMIADAATRVSTAAAVEKSRKDTAESVESDRVIRKERSDTAFSPILRASVLIGIAASLAVIVSVYLANR